MPCFFICVRKFCASYALIKNYNPKSVCLKANELSVTEASLKANELAVTKAPLCKGSCREATEELFFAKIQPFKIPPSRQAVPPPLYTREAFFCLTECNLSYKSAEGIYKFKNI